MGVADQLNAFRQAFPACRVATFADLASGLVLFASTDRRLPQERLDALCARAKLVLGDLPEAARAAIGGPAAHAVLAERDSFLVFVRSRKEPDEALVCECAPEVDLPAFIARATDELAAIDAPG